MAVCCLHFKNRRTMKKAQIIINVIYPWLLRPSQFPLSLSLIQLKPSVLIWKILFSTEQQPSTERFSTDRPTDVLIPKKVELLIRSFEPFWISRVFQISLGTFGKVELLETLGSSDEIYSLSIENISGSIETMQNALAGMV